MKLFMFMQRHRARNIKSEELKAFEAEYDEGVENIDLCNYEEAIVNFQNCNTMIKTLPEYKDKLLRANIRYNMAIAYYFLKLYDKALREAQEAAFIYTRHYSAHFLQVEILQIQKNYRDAVYVCEYVVGLDDVDIPLFVGILKSAILVYRADLKKTDNDDKKKS